MSRIIHLCLDIRGALHNWSASDFRGVFKRDDGQAMSVYEAKEALMDELALGHAVIPCAPCDNFDYQTGCQGHEVVNGTDNRPSPDSKEEPGSAE